MFSESALGSFSEFFQELFAPLELANDRVVSVTIHVEPLSATLRIHADAEVTVVATGTEIVGLAEVPVRELQLPPGTTTQN